jgi:dipeptidyl aminopeptidase/acylaminoacyl peptidase
MHVGLKNLIFLMGIICLGQGTLFPQTPESSPVPQILSTSPDGKFLVRRSQAVPGEHGEARKSLEICTTSGTVLYGWASGLGVTTTLWSPDNRYLAVNDMPGEGGDQVRLFALDSAKPAVSVLREPDGKKLIESEQERHGSFLSAIDRISLRAVEWREGRLWCLLTGSSHPKRQPTVHIPFHHLLVYGVKGAEAPVVEEEWTLSSPREQAVRDQAP